MLCRMAEQTPRTHPVQSWTKPANNLGEGRWRAAYESAESRGQVRDTDFTTLSGMDVEPAYGPADGADVDSRIGWPGEFPYTRGLYPTGYRGRPWTIRQFAGFGNAEQTNERYKMILARGGGGLSVAFDMPTLMGHDSDAACLSARSATAVSRSTAPRTWRCCSRTSRSARSPPR